MSPNPKEGQILQCELETTLKEGTFVIGTELLINSALKVQAEAAHEELGDTLDESREFTLRCMQESGITVSEGRASQILLGVANCLRDRYMGNCSTARECSGRETMEKRIARLSLLEKQNG